jgi:rod shape-determining protein MreC
MKLLSPRRLQVVIVALISLGIILLALGGYLRFATDRLNRWLVEAQAWVSTRYMALTDFLTMPREVSALRQRNAELEAEVARLQAQIIELQQRVTETEILAALVDFARANPENTYKAATVIGRDPSPFLNYVIINIGSNDGIRPGMPVVTEKGLAGRIDAVIAEAARVQLITDSASVVNVRLQNAATNAILSGSLTGELTLDMISQDVNVQVGDVVLTSGLGGGYPPNLLIGQVTSVRKLDYELFQQATVQPLVDFDHLQYVLVITNFKPLDISPLLPAPTP